MLLTQIVNWAVHCETVGRHGDDETSDSDNDERKHYNCNETTKEKEGIM